MRRRDVAFWTAAWPRRVGGEVLELGCGTGRITVPVARSGAHLVGIDRSAPMLARVARRLRRGGLTGGRRQAGAQAASARLPVSARALRDW